jgi:hypothetical protein
LHFAAGDEHGRHLHLEEPGHFHFGPSFDRQQMEGVPGSRLNPKPDTDGCLFEQFLIERLGQPPRQIVPGLDGREAFDGRFTATASPRPLLSGQIILPGVVGERLEPGPEAPLRIVAKRVHADGQVEKHLLGDILCASLLESPGAASGVDLSAVPLYELGPCRRVVWGSHQPPQQGDTRARFGGVPNGSLSRKGKNDP